MCIVNKLTDQLLLGSTKTETAMPPIDEKDSRAEAAGNGEGTALKNGQQRPVLQHQISDNAQKSVKTTTKKVAVKGSRRQSLATVPISTQYSKKTK